MHRILILIKGLGRGGAEQLLVNAAPYLNRTKFEYHVAYLLPWKDALVGELEATGLPVHCLGGGRNVAWVPRLRRFARDHKIDLVHSHSPLAAAAVRLTLGWNRPRRVYTEHNVWERFHPATYWLNLLTFPRSNNVFAVSDHVRASMRYPGPLRLMRMPPTETLYHGPDPASVGGWGRPDGVRDELGILPGAPVVGTVANFKAHKDYPTFIRAAAIVAKRIPDVRFVLVGLGPLEKDIKRLAGRLGLNGTVVFAGYREDAPRVAGAFDVFVLSSLHEGLSIAAVEAMVQGVPAVVTDVGGLPEVVEHEHSGLIVPPKDPAALARSIVRVLEDDADRKRMGENARARGAEFDIRNSVRRMEQVYEELLA
ncbi:MAG: glycosyltransferase [Actinomycetota bacterium]